jgi:hypothetical protein
VARIETRKGSLHLDQWKLVGTFLSTEMKSTCEKQREEETTPTRSPAVRRMLEEYAADLRAILAASEGARPRARARRFVVCARLMARQSASVADFDPARYLRISVPIALAYVSTGRFFDVYPRRGWYVVHGRWGSRAGRPPSNIPPRRPPATPAAIWPFSALAGAATNPELPRIGAATSALPISSRPPSRVQLLRTIATVLC